MINSLNSLAYEYRTHGSERTYWTYDDFIQKIKEDKKEIYKLDYNVNQEKSYNIDDFVIDNKDHVVKKMWEDKENGLNLIKIDLEENFYCINKTFDDFESNESLVQWEDVFSIDFIDKIVIRKNLWQDRINKVYEGEKRDACLEQLNNIYNKVSYDVISKYTQRFSSYFQNESFDEEMFSDNIMQILNEKEQQLVTIKHNHEELWNTLINYKTKYVGYSGNKYDGYISQVGGLSMQRNISDAIFSIEELFKEKLIDSSMDNVVDDSNVQGSQLERMNYYELSHASKALGSVYTTINTLLPYKGALTMAATWGQAKSKIHFFSKNILPGELGERFKINCDFLIEQKINEVNTEISNIIVNNKKRPYSIMDNSKAKAIMQEFSKIGTSSNHNFFNNFANALNKLRNGLDKSYGRIADSHNYIPKLAEDWNAFMDSLPKSYTEGYYFSSESNHIVDLQL